MEIDIGEIVSTVHAVDGDSVLSPRTIERIVRIVLDAVNSQEEHRKRLHSEQRITGGVREELEEIWR